MTKLTAHELVEAQNLLASAKKEERWLSRQLEQVAGAAQQWKQRAMSAVRAGDDVVARDALVRQSECGAKADEIRSTLAQKRQDIDRLALEVAQPSLPAEAAKSLAKAPTFATTKPLAKTKGAPSEADSPPARAGATRERTKR
jgi:phage shock protein A